MIPELWCFMTICGAELSRRAGSDSSTCETCTTYSWFYEGNVFMNVIRLHATFHLKWAWIGKDLTLLNYFDCLRISSTDFRQIKSTVTQCLWNYYCVFQHLKKEVLYNMMSMAMRPTHVKYFLLQFPSNNFSTFPKFSIGPAMLEILRNKLLSVNLL